jgi:hypothetical protein
MKTLTAAVLIVFMGSVGTFAQVDSTLIDDFFHSLPTRLYYWTVEEELYGSLMPTSFSAAVLRRPGREDEYVFQESRLALRKFGPFMTYYYTYFPDDVERDTSLEIHLPDARVVKFTDTRHPRTASAEELDSIKSRIERFTDVLVTYNELYREHIYSRRGGAGEAFLLGLFGYGFSGLAIGLGAAAEDGPDGWPIAGGIMGCIITTIAVVDAIHWGAVARERNAELERLEKRLTDMVRATKE